MTPRNLGILLRVRASSASGESGSVENPVGIVQIPIKWELDAKSSSHSAAHAMNRTGPSTTLHFLGEEKRQLPDLVEGYHARCAEVVIPFPRSPEVDNDRGSF